MAGTCLIGHTGFVGGNLARQHLFEEFYNSQNIEQIGGKSYELLVCCGVSAVKWQANRFPAKDRFEIDRLLENLKRVNAKKAILISTFDVYPRTAGVDESFDPHEFANHAYGSNRLYAEDAFRRLFNGAHVVRLPTLFGSGLKKNILYDLLHDNNLEAIDLNGSLQYYDLRLLWGHLQLALESDLKLVNFATEPIKTGEIVQRYFPATRIGEESASAPSYDVRTLYARYFGGSRDYLQSAEQTIELLGEWIAEARRQPTAGSAF